MVDWVEVAYACVGETMKTSAAAALVYGAHHVHGHIKSRIVKEQKRQERNARRRAQRRARREQQKS